MPTLPELQDAPLSVRAVNALSKAGYRTVAQCLNLTEAQLLAIDNIGKKTVSEILAYLEEFRSLDGNLSDEISMDSLDNSEHAANFEYLKVALALPIAEIPFTVRVKNFLGLLKIKYLKDLVLFNRRQLLAQKNAGSKSLREITYFLNRLGLALGMSLNPSLLEKVNGYLQACGEEPVKLIENFKKAYPGKVGVLEEIRSRTIGPDRMEFYKRCFELYKQGGTLEYVAKAISLTRERARQILVKGAKLGLFRYVGREYPYVPKEKLLSDLTKTPSITKVARINNISTVYLKRLLLSYHIAAEQIEKFKERLRKQRAIDEYNAVKRELGHYPTTTELQAKSKWRSLESRIRRYWGIFQNFREEMSIPSPPPFVEAIRPWIEHRTRLALIRRMQDLDTVRECLMETNPLTTSEIARRCSLTPMRAFKLTQMLVATGEAVREGIGSQTKYRVKMPEE